ncbi:MAG: TrkA C-terminal domain-containing protein [Clostridium perfringens]|nr:TrkA C-terminal domain-containing protein [Clostridium perfringens]
MTIVFFMIFMLIFLILVEILCILFKLTGLTDEKARFQVISLITSTGFTTKESELIVNHKTRRRLAEYVMILGYVGMATIVSFMAKIISDILLKKFSTFDIGIFIMALVVVFYFLKHPKIVQCLDSFIEKVIIKNQNRSMSKKTLWTLIKRKHGYGIYNIFIDENSLLVGKSILECNLRENEIQILNIDKGNEFIGCPNTEQIIEISDNLTVYGKVENIIKIFKIK